MSAGKKILIDLEAAIKNGLKSGQCNYYYHQDNKGLEHILAVATMALICHRCEDKPCVRSCPTEALGVDQAGYLCRYNIRCVSCQSCQIACPFGVIYPEILDYLASKCDYCLDRSDDQKAPYCVDHCQSGVLSWVEGEEEPDRDIYQVGPHLLVRVKPWLLKKIEEKEVRIEEQAVKKERRYQE